MKYLCLTLVLILGCTENKPADSNPQVGQGLARIQTDVSTAAVNVEAAKPHTDAIGQVHLSVASTALADASKQAVTTLAEQKQANEQRQQLETLYDKTIQELKDERSRFFSSIQRRMVWWGVGIAGVLGICLILIRFTPLAIPGLGWLKKG